MSPPSRPTESLNRTLRQTTILTYPPAFIILLIHGILSGQAVPAIALIPLACSAFIGAWLLHHDRLASIGSPIQRLTAANVFVADVVLAVTLLVMLILSWIFVPKNRGWGRQGLTMLGTYGTVLIMINFGIHTYFALGRTLIYVQSLGCQCPHCQSKVKHRNLTGFAAEYTPLTDVEEEEAYRDVETGASARTVAE